jgi:2-polyprenyl-6-methoxyphenol hydroxylase-like FAD-dependent oxidoreductase
VKVGIAGAGIGGLTLGLLLHQRGIEAEIWESVADLKPLGVGINLLPHATRELSDLGLLAALGELAIETSSLGYYNKFGQLIWQEPRGSAAGYAWPQLSVHRGEFQLLLLAAVRERLGSDSVRTGQRVVGFSRQGERVSVELRDRRGDPLERTVDVLIGADGVRSALRAALYPERDPLCYSGRVMWRAAVEVEPFLDGRSMIMAGHPDQKFVAYPISERSRQSGKSVVNWIAELRVPGETGEHDWNRRVDKSVFAAAFSGWRWDFIDVPGLIESAEAIYEYPLADKDPLPRWTFERVTLLGDAAHPMYPIGSNGSAQAILDARCLADCLGSFRDPREALLEYEAERLPKTAGIVLRNRLHGPEQVMYLAEARAPHGFSDIAQVISRAELEEIALRYKRLAGFDPQSLAGAEARSRASEPRKERVL